MKSEINSIEDIKAIRKLMEESSRFLSLSGLSGVFAGVTAILGALVAWVIILKNGTIKVSEFYINFTVKESSSVIWQLLLDASVVLLLSLLFSLYFSLKKVRRDGKIFWTPVSKRLLINLLIPLITGGVFTIVFIIYHFFNLIIPGFLIFYGLALVNAGKFTFGELFYLGILEIITGLISAFLPGLDLIFWVIGFGLLHIIYGLAMFRKYGA
jgi:hypothetical protein